jgi:hypothetical protein
MRIRLLIIFGLFPGFWSFMRAQPASVIWKLAKAKALVKDWEGARNLIKPHIFPAPDDSLAPGLIQLYALSNFRTGDVVTALVSNDRLESEYPNWHRIGILFEAEICAGMGSFR